MISTAIGLCAWLALVWLLTLGLAPSGSTATDLHVVVGFQILTPVGAFHASGGLGRSRAYWLYFVYGVLAATAFLLLGPDVLLPVRHARVNWDQVVGGAILIAVMGPLCVGVAKFRHRKADEEARRCALSNEPRTHTSPVGRFVIWLPCVFFCAFAAAPGLNRISYPQIPDLLAFLLIPLAAMHIAGRTRSKWVFGVFGMIASLPFLSLYLDDHYSWFWFSDPPMSPMWVIGVFSTLFVIATGLLARWAGGLRLRMLERKPDPSVCWVCEYNLTGNVSGVCPECGTALDQPPAPLPDHRDEA